MSRMLKAALAAILAAILLWAPALAGPPAGGDPLPSWQGPVKERIVDYVRAVTTQGGRDFIPPAERIAAFDLDGTLIMERPAPFVAEIALVWLGEHCPGFGDKGPQQAQLCAALSRRDRQELRKLIEPLLALPFMGMELDDYRALARRVFETHPNAIKKTPLRKLIYQPQLELLAFLRSQGFAIWLCSGSSIGAMQAISSTYLGVPPWQCLGTRYAVEVGQEGKRLTFKRGALRPGLLNLLQAKAENLKLATVTGPVLAFGNSRGDEWMLRYAASSARRSLVLLLDHDDPREAVYAKPDLLAQAREQGWTVVSMKQAWKRVFE